MIPFFVTIPHSGLKIPPEAHWLQELPDTLLNCDVDFYVDELYESALKKNQIPSIRSPWHRYAVDLNRFSHDISPLTVQGAPKSSSQQPSDVHWHRTTKGDTLMKQAISKNLHNELIEKYFQPFHLKIRDQFQELKKQQHKNILLLDLHSMPSQALDFHKDSGSQRKDIVLGTLQKKSSDQSFIDLVFEAYQQQGFDVGIDWPYQGGAITQSYGDFSKGQHVIQIEINRALYMDEVTKKKNKNFFHMQEKLKKILNFIHKSLEK